MKKVFVSIPMALLILLVWINSCFSQNLNDILKKHVDALGGKENLLKVKALFSKATIKVGGLEGKLRVWWIVPDRMRQEADFSIFKQLIVYDSEDFWLKDQNGKVREMVGYERKRLEQELYFEAFAYLFPERGKGEKKLVGEKEQDGKNISQWKSPPRAASPGRFSSTAQITL